MYCNLDVTMRTSVCRSFLLIFLIFFLWNVQKFSILYFYFFLYHSIFFKKKMIFHLSIKSLFLFPSFFFIYTLKVKKKKKKKIYFSGSFHNLSVSIIVFLYLFFFLSIFLPVVHRVHFSFFFSNVLMLWWIARNPRTEFASQPDPLHSHTGKYNW